METLKAKVIQEDENHFIRITNADKMIKIPLTDDNPHGIKKAFNELIMWAKADEIEIEMEEVAPDLFSQVASEYVTQLSREIQEVRREMEKVDLVDLGN